MLRDHAHDEVPEFVQIDGTSNFRINRPVDIWPDIALAGPRGWLEKAQIDELSARLCSAATADDTVAFEVAVCDVLAALGFVKHHYGGNGEPDGIAAAPLGIVGYRLVVECKTASPGANVTNPRPEEAAKFREPFGATLSMLVGPQFGNDASLENELAMHAVSLWTIDDLALALRENIGPYELRSAFRPGRAATALADILWERGHGRRKRVAVIADRLHRCAWRTQTALADGVALAQTPAMTKEVLFVLVDDALVAEGVSSGATREEFEAGLASALAQEILALDGSNGYVATEPDVRPA